MTSSPDLWAIEIKSGQTIASDFFKGLDYFEELHKTEQERLKKVLVYGGDQEQKRSSAHVIPWNRLNDIKL